MKKILIVDDTKHLLEEVTDILEMEGYKVTKANDAFEGFASIDREIPDLIITDLFMPEMDGFTFVSHIRSREKYVTIPIIILSANSDNAIKSRAEALRVEDYLVKPCAADNLIAAVNDVVG